MARTWPSAADLALDIKREVENHDDITAIRLLMDGVNRLPDAAAHGQLAEALQEPASTGDIRWDTLLAASIRYRLHSMGERAPEWTFKQPLDRFWFPIRGGFLKAYNDMARTPAELQRVGIFMDRNGFTAA